MAKATSKKGSLFIQPEGPNTEMFYLGCHTMGDLTDSTGGAVTPFYCWDPSGDGWELAGELTSPPDKISFTIDTRVDADGRLDWTENCEVSVQRLRLAPRLRTQRSLCQQRPGLDHAGGNETHYYV